MRFIEPVRSWYGRFERPISSLSLVAGFLFDALTLKRVDNLWENVWVLTHLVIVGAFIAVIHIHKSNDNDEKNPEKAHFWYVNILQFFFGGILSTYLVFYFRSADILVTWPFIALLVLAFWANESLKRHYIRLGFQIGLFFLSVFSFAIFIVPVLLHKIGDQVFILSGLFSLAFIALYILFLFHFIKDKLIKKRRLLFWLIAGIYITVNVLYFGNLIPPIPLSLKDAGVYHTLQKEPDGNYLVGYEDLGFGGYFQLYQNFKETPFSPVYAYTSIFSPSNLNINIVHQWQHYDEASGQWVSESKINLSVIGGRGQGFRTYSVRMNLSAGKWRVNVLTTQGQLIGRLRFNVVPVSAEPALVTDVK